MSVRVVWDEIKLPKCTDHSSSPSSAQICSDKDFWSCEMVLKHILFEEVTKVQQSCLTEENRHSKERQEQER